MSENLTKMSEDVKFLKGYCGPVLKKVYTEASLAPGVSSPGSGPRKGRASSQRAIKLPETMFNLAQSIVKNTKIYRIDVSRPKILLTNLFLEISDLESAVPCQC